MKFIIIVLFFAINHAPAMDRPPWAGFFTIKSGGTIDRTRFPYIKGYADRVQWRQLEPKPGVYDWSKMDAAIREAANGKYYYYFVLWTGPHSPCETV